ncbi:hypothetical protein [Selenomonas ruminantium]|uniref:Phage major capsid protein n=1 Tax=Selenomonas ruminantium TaxID=971 RepID=A0A1H4AFD3_SELRU|nr:hypothetical protein [Selenomonas ruminantium]SEA09404.1 hypothetical protein SAMN05660648_01901 [Selenomonas ruminantium]SEA34448.1 hypothetical protein SAMN05660648_02858 [Selenomonas ruminantium]
MVNLVTEYKPYVDELFTRESKISLLTNKDFSFDGAKTVKIYKVSTVATTDYDRAGTGTGATGSRYGEVQGIDTDIETFTLAKDRSFTFAVDKMDVDETGHSLAADKALAREIREVVIPEIDTHIYSKIVAGAGTSAEAAALTASNILDKILDGNNTLDNYDVPEAGRCLVVTPDVYYIMKKCKDIVMETEQGQDMRLKGVIANLDGMNIIKVPASRLPAKFGFMIVHPCATVAPVKLEDYKIHKDPPGISGNLVEGRFYFDAFVMDNKAKAIYYQPLT